jgi:hypothetical protein
LLALRASKLVRPPSNETGHDEGDELHQPAVLEEEFKEFFHARTIVAGSSATWVAF